MVFRENSLEENNEEPCVKNESLREIFSLKNGPISSRRQWSPTKRPQMPCIFPNCNRATTSIPRHLKQYHKLEPIQATKEMQNSAEIIRSPPRNTPKGQHGIYVKCPFCPSRVLRIEDHLKQNCRNRRMLPCSVEEIIGDLEGQSVKTLHDDSIEGTGTYDSDDDPDSKVSDIDFTVTDESAPTHALSTALIDMLASFSSWLTSIAGSCMKDKTAELYTGAIRSMLLAHGGTVLSITRISSMADKNGYLEELRKKVKAATIRAHLCALKKFFTFLLQHRRYGFCKGFCEDGIQDVVAWLKGTRRLVLEERHAFREKEETIVGQIADLLPQYRSFKARESSINLLETMDTNAILTREEFCSIQRYLIIELILINGQRSGVIRNATHDEFLSTTGNETEGYIMKVTDHKTYAKYGPANLFIEVQLYRHMKIWYSAKGRFFSHLKLHMPDNVFCTDKGKKLSSGYTASELTQAFSTEGHSIIVEGEAESVTPTRVRKAHHLLRRAQGSSEISHQEFCAHLTHTPATAEACYDSVNKLHRARTVSRELQANMECRWAETTKTKQATRRPVSETITRIDQALNTRDFDLTVNNQECPTNEDEDTNYVTPIVSREPHLNEQLLPLEPDLSTDVEQETLDDKTIPDDNSNGHNENVSCTNSTLPITSPDPSQRNVTLTQLSPDIRQPKLESATQLKTNEDPIFEDITLPIVVHEAFPSGHILTPEEDTIVELPAIQEGPRNPTDNIISKANVACTSTNTIVKETPSGKNTHGRRAGFTEQHEQVLIREFPDFLKTGRGNIREIKDTILRYDDLKELFAGFTAKQITDKLRSLRKNLNI